MDKDSAEFIMTGIYEELQYEIFSLQDTIKKLEQFKHQVDEVLSFISKGAQ